MDYGTTFSQFLKGMEADMSQFDDWSIGMELDMTTNTLTNQQRKSNASDQKEEEIKATASDPLQASLQKADAMGKKLLDTINRLHNQTFKFLQSTWQGNENFIAQYNDMAQNFRQVDAITVINWSYGHDMEQYLHAKVVKLRAIVTTNINYLGNWQNIPEDAPINKEKTAMIQQLLHEMGAPSAVDSESEFMGHLRTQFRGRKSEKMYNGAMAEKMMQELRSFAKTRSVYTQDIQSAERLAKTANTTMQAQLRNSNFQDSDRTMLMKYYTAVCKMLTLYVEMIKFVYTMETEYILNRRAIITRLYEK